jgi:hypothetical protein
MSFQNNMPTRRRRRTYDSNKVALSPAKIIPEGVQTFGIRVENASDTAPLKHFYTYMGYDNNLINCGQNCNLTKELYDFARRVCNYNTTGTLLGQSKVMTDSVRQLLQCDRNRRLQVYDSDAEIDKLKSHSGLKLTNQNEIFEYMRKSAANAKIFKNYIKGESNGSFTVSNNKVTEKMAELVKKNKSTNFEKYKFAVDLLRTGLYNMWIEKVEKSKKSIIDDFTKKVLDARVSPSRVKDDLIREEEFLKFRKSKRKQKIGMDFGSFTKVSSDDLQKLSNIQKLSIKNKGNDKSKIFDLIFKFRSLTKKNNDAIESKSLPTGWVLQTQTVNQGGEKKEVRTGLITKGNDIVKYSVLQKENPYQVLKKHLLKKNKLDNHEYDFLVSNGVDFVVHATPVARDVLRKIPILVKENIKLEKYVKFANIVTKKIKEKQKNKERQRESNLTQKTIVHPNKTQIRKANTKTNPKAKEVKSNDKKIEDELSKPIFDVKMFRPEKEGKSATFKVKKGSDLLTRRKIDTNEKVKKCYHHLKNYVQQEEKGLMVKIKRINGMLKCKADKKGIPEISLNNN